RNPRRSRQLPGRDSVDFDIEFKVLPDWGSCLAGSNLKGVLPKWHGPFQARLTLSVIPSEVEESLILTITSSKRCLDCTRHDKKPVRFGETPKPARETRALPSHFVRDRSWRVIRMRTPMA